MKTLRFLGNTMPEYQGHDGNGQTLAVKKGEQIELEDGHAADLVRHYPRDFAIVDSDKEHAPEQNKMASKTSKFKSK